MFSLEQYRALHEGAVLLDRSFRGRIRLTGADRRSYLQGLLTNDIAALTAGTGAYAALLTAQGRMIADMYVIETGDAILMDVEPDVTARVAAHLDQFIFSEDAQVHDVTGDTVQLGVFGPGAAGAIAGGLALGVTADALAALRPLANVSASRDGAAVTIVARDDLGVPGFDLVADRAAADALTAALREAGASAITREVAEVARVESGRPLFHADMDEDTIPLEAGIEDRAISMNKGCYVGQEIIVRVLHRGHGRVARRLVGLALEASAPVPARGDTIKSGARDIGAITSAVLSPALGRPLAMGYVHRDFAAPATAVSVATGGALHAAAVTELPLRSPA
jgi:folate-binding protein YgfZ